MECLFLIYFFAVCVAINIHSNDSMKKEEKSFNIYAPALC